MATVGLAPGKVDRADRAVGGVRTNAMTKMKRVAAGLAASVFLGMSSGCVVIEIRDELVAVNQNLDTVGSRLDAIETQLAEIEPQLEPLPYLERLDSLESITTSLDDIDQHLASLRKTISSIDSAVPFLKFSDPEPEPEEEPAAEAESETAGGG